MIEQTTSRYAEQSVREMNASMIMDVLDMPRDWDAFDKLMEKIRNDLGKKETKSKTKAKEPFDPSVSAWDT